jgi:hypothetical protein
MSVLRVKVAGDGRKSETFTRDDIIEALREYGALYGDDFAQSAFSPSQAKRNGRPELVERYYTPRADGSRWPSLNGIKAKFDGSWNDARAAAGFAPNSTGPKRGRRPSGSAPPILDVRERLVYVPHEKTRQLTVRLNRTQERLRDALAARDKARAELREARQRARPVARAPEVRERRVPGKTKTITKTVKVKDERALERLRARLAAEQAKVKDADAALRAVQAQLAAESRDHEKAMVRAERAELEMAEATGAAREAARERARAEDRLAAAETRIDRLTGELEHAREQLMGNAEAAMTADLVRHADTRADQAEVRAARAEREMAEQAAAITGELRRLTVGELAELREAGPAGRAVMEKAIKGLLRALAAGGKGPLDEALDEVARAAVTWRERL